MTAKVGDGSMATADTSTGRDVSGHSAGPGHSFLTPWLGKAVVKMLQSGLEFLAVFLKNGVRGDLLAFAHHIEPCFVVLAGESPGLYLLTSTGGKCKFGVIPET